MGPFSKSGPKVDLAEEFKPLTRERWTLLDTATAIEAARLHLYSERNRPASIANYPHRVFAPGVAELIVLDLAGGPLVVSHEGAEALGGVETLRQAGLANLGELRPDTIKSADLPEGGVFRTAMSDSPFMASCSVRMPQFASDVAGDVATDNGWLLSIPSRHQLAWHMIRDLSVVEVVNAMAQFAQFTVANAPGPLDASVFWWNGEAYEQIIAVDATGQSVSVAPDSFVQTLTRIRDASA